MDSIKVIAGSILVVASDSQMVAVDIHRMAFDMVGAIRITITGVVVSIIVVKEVVSTIVMVVVDKLKEVNFVEHLRIIIRVDQYGH